jgi:hypothetical protein
MYTHTAPNTSDSDAIFLGWQETSSGTPLALYNVTAVDHPSYGSTVSRATLRKLKLHIPKAGPHKRGAKMLRTHQLQIKSVDC